MVSYLQNVSLAAREGKDCYCIYNIKGYFWWQQLTFLLLWESAWSTLNWQEVYLIVDLFIVSWPGYLTSPHLSVSDGEENWYKLVRTVHWHC